MTTRAQAAENALASVRAEGLDPGVAEALLRRWARGELSDAQLDDAAHQISTGELLAPPRAQPRASAGEGRERRELAVKPTPGPCCVLDRARSATARSS